MARFGLCGLAAVLFGTVSVAAATTPRAGFENSVKLGDVPFAVNIISYSSRSVPSGHTCVGVILNKEYVLTLATCAYYRDFKEGVRDLSPYTKMAVLTNSLIPFMSSKARDSSSDDSTTAAVVEVDKFFIPPQFYPDGGNATSGLLLEKMKHDYNLAVLKLKQPLEFNATVQAIPLFPESGDKLAAASAPLTFIGDDNRIKVVNGTTVNTYGWTRVTIPLASKEYCYTKSEPAIRPGSQFLCTDNSVHSRDEDIWQCHSDAGGPVYAQVDAKDDKSIALVGLQYPSLGDPCSPKNSFQVIDLYHLHDFIANVTGLKTADLIYNPKGQSSSSAPSSGSNSSGSSGDSSKSSNAPNSGGLSGSLGSVSLMCATLAALVAAAH
ncbi:trypsin-like serine protease [Ramicandelaber brevisporus]|nr:trypsin-like serine protease [Ramicandelaber brevisporus]